MTEEEFKAALVELLAHLGEALPQLHEGALDEKVRKGMDAVRKYLKEGLEG